MRRIPGLTTGSGAQRGARPTLKQVIATPMLAVAFVAYGGIMAGLALICLVFWCWKAARLALDFVFRR